MAQARDNYENTFVRSPVDGIVIRRYVNPGESISYESLYQPVVSVADTTHLMARTEVDEMDIGKIRLDQRAEIRCEAFPGKTFHGYIVRISGGLGKKKVLTDNPTEKIDTDILEAFIEIDAGSSLRVGLRVHVCVPLARKENVLVVPGHAVQLADGLAVVRLRTSAGIQSRPVQLGAQDGMYVEITEGL